jgi:hypothetical protein
MSINLLSQTTTQVVQFPLGIVDFLGTNIAAGQNANMSILNGVVTMNLQLPQTAATAATDITFANNTLPAQFRPSVNRVVPVYVWDATAPATSRAGVMTITNAGVFSIALTANAVNADNCILNNVIQYSL